ncbi:hypothetical protein JYK14_08265 [Siccirubricoccus sp. KC 17139]|uniref:Uncharacterized protein n=1 Tax=Siccirubricoccus soli TaxID=2899147 RepID=A0ABT1D574_9PROT|nr:hypothetical protein [Siccirubricoccus soli]MCO6416160.1 hypothetical protein [Siccirubricoccus soli]MCP2682294.1 hypothetical protein [Siccirubricoccus soli]
MAECADPVGDDAVAAVTREDDPVDRTIRNLRLLAGSGNWGGVEVLLGWRRELLGDCIRPDVVEFLRELEPRLAAARARAAIDGWESLKVMDHPFNRVETSRMVWWCPTRVEDWV